MSSLHNKVGVIMLARPQFDTQYAQENFEIFNKILRENNICTEVIDQGITVPDEALAVAEKLNTLELDAVIVIQGTFTDASLILKFVTYINKPVLIWAVKEEANGERLRLNSFCGLNLGAHALVAAGKKFKGVYGPVDSAKVWKKIVAFVRAAGAAKWLKGKRIGLFGHRPAGYYASNFQETSLYELLGVSVDYFSLQDIFDVADNIENPDFPFISDLPGCEALDKKACEKSIRAYYALKKIIAEKKLDAVAVECWPEFMNKYGGAACFSLGKLNDEGIVAACEADVNGAITMLLGQYFSQKATFIADLICGDEEINELTFWHCGAGPQSLKAQDSEVVPGIHPNRKIPLALYFPLQEGFVTIGRLSPDKNNKLRLLIGGGVGIKRELMFHGNTLPVKIETPVEEAIDSIIYNGLEHHYILTYGDFTEELKEFANLVNLEILKL
ncbi:MAG: fucose isomerase [Clostridiaceae bacterium BRH_c20a]|nr:MAG: fucose isomerase [Clostridiaceae bacterium BRH_c20a]